MAGNLKVILLGQFTFEPVESGALRGQGKKRVFHDCPDQLAVSVFGMVQHRHQLQPESRRAGRQAKESADAVLLLLHQFQERIPEIIDWQGWHLLHWYGGGVIDGQGCGSHSQSSCFIQRTVM